jgi:cysteine desulfurase / selenocysteine lyase
VTVPRPVPQQLVLPGDFPAADKCTYLTYHGAHQATAAWQADIAESGTLNFDEVAEERVFDSLRDSFAQLIGARAADIAVASSATELLASLAWAVAPGEGTNVVGVDVTFPSSIYPWVRVAHHTGCEVRWVRARDTEVSEDDIVAAIDDATAVVSLSHVEYASGQRYDLVRLAEAAHARGALLVVDASQSVGAIPVDITREPVDALVTTSYKWLCGPFGVGLMYLAPRLQRSLEPGLVGWRSHKDIYQLQADRIEYPDAARRFEFSTMAYGCAIGLTEAICYLQRIGIDRIYSHNLSLADRLAAELSTLGAQVVSPRTGNQRTSIVSARFPGRDPANIVNHLGARGIIVSARRDFVRLSLHLYNSDRDVDRVLAEVVRDQGRLGGDT